MKVTTAATDWQEAVLFFFLVHVGRQNGVGLNAMCSRVAGILAPLIRLLNVYHHSIPMILYGVIPLAAGGLCVLLPETLNMELQDVAQVQ